MTRLLTLTGVGGCGKTRLALEVAKGLVGAYPDGVWLVELAGLSEEGLLPQEVANALEVQEQPGHPILETLVNALRKKNMLLILDNCEHLVEACAHLVDRLLASCSKLRVLTTSREALNTPGEMNVPVLPLSLPHLRHPLTAEGLLGYESARLFVERARCRNPVFMLTQQNTQAVAKICQRLEGIPLAIELAAARVGLSAEQIAERLEDSLKLLTTGSRSASQRQKTLRGALQWSFELLSEPERKLFGRLSVVAGGCTLEAAEAVGAGDGIEKEEVLDLLSGLVDKSLVVAKATGEGEVRYRMLEPVRQYAQEKLKESGEVGAARRRHAVFFLALAEDAEARLHRSEQGAWLKHLETEHDNFRAALSWALEEGEAELGLRISGALGEFWHTRGHLDEGRRWLEAALANSSPLPMPARVKALTRAGYIAWEQGDYQRATALGEEGLALARESGDRSGVAAALLNLGTVAVFRMELERASELLEEALVLRRALGDAAGVGRVLWPLGLLAVARHDYGRGVTLHEEGLQLTRQIGDELGIVLLLGQGAQAYLGLEDYERETALCAQGLELSRQLEHSHALVFILHIAAVLGLSQGKPDRVARLWGAAEALREAIGGTFSAISRHVYGPYIAAARAQLDEAAWEEACTQGRAMTPEEAIEYALLEEEEPAPCSTTPEEPSDHKPPVRLTRREEEIAALIAQGLTNRQIAEELTLSERTVDTHVGRILKKLDLRSREQIAARLVE